MSPCTLSEVKDGRSNPREGREGNQVRTCMSFAFVSAPLHPMFLVIAVRVKFDGTEEFTASLISVQPVPADRVGLRFCFFALPPLQPANIFRVSARTGVDSLPRFCKDCPIAAIDTKEKSWEKHLSSPAQLARRSSLPVHARCCVRIRSVQFTVMKPSVRIRVDNQPGRIPVTPRSPARHNSRSRPNLELQRVNNAQTPEFRRVPGPRCHRVVGVLPPSLKVHRCSSIRMCTWCSLMDSHPVTHFFVLICFEPSLIPAYGRFLRTFELFTYYFLLTTYYR